MTRCAIAVLLAVAALSARAECGFTRSDGTMTVVVGKDSKCSSGFREAFRSDIVASVQAMNDADNPRAVSRNKKSFDDRSQRNQKLWTLEERAYQSRGPTGRYYGQRQ